MSINAPRAPDRLNGPQVSGPRSACRICVFAKTARAGEAKTRLIPAVGPDAAALLARAFFRDTWSALRGISWASLVVAATERDHRFDTAGAEVCLQGEGDLGERMERVLREALREADSALAVGTDSPGIPVRVFEQARSALADHDAVIGPSDDGGFYLLGLKRCPDGLLRGLPWSRSDTCEHTIARLKSRGFRVGVLERWFDVDLPADLERLSKLLASGAVSAPETAAALRTIGWRSPHRISIVIPTLNEAARIGRTLEELSSMTGIHEVIVADGGSGDRTAEIAQSFAGVRVIRANRGRAAQMNAGAAVAAGEIILFLHADVSLPRDAASLIERALDRPGTIAGAFKTWTVSDSGRTWLAPLLHLADLRSRYTSLPYGDQAIFVTADAFKRVGGIPDQPLLEDLEFSRRLRRLGRLETVPASVIVSGRRFLARPVYYALLINLIPLLYRLGVPVHTLKRLYGNPR